MKSILATSLSVLLAAVASISCSSVSDIEPTGLPEFQAVRSAKVTGIIPTTRATYGSTVKSEWNGEDWIYTYNNGRHSYFRANEEGSDSSFTLSGNDSDWSDGVAYAAYPKSVKFSDGRYVMSFNGQNGTLSTASTKYNLMTSKSEVVDGEASFTFTSQTAVLAIPAEDIMYSGTRATKVVVSGENFSSLVCVSIEDGEIIVRNEGRTELVVNSPSVEDGMIFVSLLPTSGSLSVDLYDNIGGHFFCSIADASALTAGSIHDLGESKWDGGIEITFNPTVGSWD